MIRKKEYFSKKPFGMIWLCSECDHVHLRYGNITVSMDDDLVDELLSLSCNPDYPIDVCSECNGIHLNCRLATLHMSCKDFDQFLSALYRFVLKTPIQAESKTHIEKVYNN